MEQGNISQEGAANMLAKLPMTRQKQWKRVHRVQRQQARSRTPTMHAVLGGKKSGRWHPGRDGGPESTGMHSAVVGGGVAGLPGTPCPDTPTVPPELHNLGGAFARCVAETSVRSHMLLVRCLD